MINKIRIRTGGYTRGVSNSVKYIMKTKPTEESDSLDSSIPKADDESDQEYANRVESVFESCRVKNQKNLYQHNTLSFHPTEADNLSNAQMIEIAKELYLKEGMGNKNRHHIFVVERDKEHPHVHALIHLTDLDSKRVHNKFIDYNPISEKLEKNTDCTTSTENPAPSIIPNNQATKKNILKIVFLKY